MRTRSTAPTDIKQAPHRPGVRQVLIFLLAVLMVSQVLGIPLNASKLAFAETTVAADTSQIRQPASQSQVLNVQGETPVSIETLASFTTIGQPTITSDDKKGLPVIGVALHANPGVWSPQPSSFSYQWYSFESAITGATKASYVPVMDDYCNEISVKITAHLDGYDAITVQTGFVQPEPAVDDDGDGDNNGDPGDGTGGTGEQNPNTGTKNSDNFRSASLPWAPLAATGNYIKDNYATVPASHVFEDVTQERLLDILSSSGNYYIVLSGPSRTSSQKILSAINEQAQLNGITKIYHFDPLIDGYQADITKPNTPYKTTESINSLWTRITALLPTGAPLNNYDLTDTLLFRYSASQIYGTRGNIAASYSFEAAQVNSYDANAEKPKIDAVFKNGGVTVASSVRTDLQFFNRVYNASATLVNSRMFSLDPAYGVDAPSVTLFDGLNESNFKLHQINFTELQNLYNTPGEHIILYGASWCHNTQAIIGTIATQAAKNPDIKTVYVYDTTLGNQIRYGTGAAINTATAYSSTFNSRTSATANPAGNNNVSYIYGEAVRPLGGFLTENTTNRNNSIQFYANGDLSGATPLSNVEPWLATSSTAAQAVNASRLQLPFLVAYNKDASTANKAVRQWLHQQKTAANAGKYIEYMLELAWVRAGQSSSVQDAAAKGVQAAYESSKLFANGGITNDEGLTLAAAAAEAIAQVNYVLQVSDDTGGFKGPNQIDTGGDTTDATSTAGSGTTANNQSPLPVTPIYYRQGAGTAAASSNSNSAVPVTLASGNKPSALRISAQIPFVDIPEAATPLGAGSAGAGEGDYTLPLAVALLLTAIAIFSIIGVSTGFIPTPKNLLAESSV